MNSSEYHHEQFRVAAELEIDEVIDGGTGQCVASREIIGTDRERLFKLRSEVVAGIQAARPLYLCSLCHVPVKLIAPFDKGAHFRHLLEDGRCPAQTRGSLSEKEIRACKYNGAKESEAHRMMKAWLATSLRVDSRFSGVDVEETWNGISKADYRRPDVQAIWAGIRVAFEIQLSTTFLDVIVERREFYRREGGLLFWVFKEFPLERRLMTLDDVFYNNNLNAFVVSEETAKRSQESGGLIMDCHWVQPAVSSNRLVEEWRQKEVGFGELHLDVASQRAWYFDVDKARQEIAQQLRQQPIALLKARLRDACIKFMDESASYDERVTEWNQIGILASSLGLQLPDYDKGYKLRKLLLYLFSVEEGKPVGFKFPKLVQVAHHAFDHYKPFLWHLGRGLNAFGRTEQLQCEDNSQKWQSRREETKRRMSAREAEFLPDRTHDLLVFTLFPPIALNAHKTAAS